MIIDKGQPTASKRGDPHEEYLIGYRMFIKYCIFSRILESMSPPSRQHSAAFGCKKKITSQ